MTSKSDNETPDAAVDMAAAAVFQICVEAGLDPVSRVDMGPSQLMVFDGAGEKVEVRVLLAERQYWREHQACEIGALLHALDHRKAPKAFLIERLANAYTGLKDAMAGEFFEHCEGCGRQIWPDEAQFPYSDVSAHADCDGTGAIKVGDQIPVDPDAIDEDLLEPGEEKPTHVTAFARGPLFSDEQLRERLASAHATLAKAGRV
ncbi:hypothetical protein [Caulobacter sp. Root1472]|uniref:hypothetical protein n=1 Tax=Caulobacter sp. Root1472 TaxID=1736470 RepID=UPI0006FE3BBC|nr:hypothetical protein [Caulobacter sp. Root1472]KQZ31701.1 hypothetical protein ASD47_15625 [Caulobacter sp. Root1472]